MAGSSVPRSVWQSVRSRSTLTALNSYATPQTAPRTSVRSPALGSLVPVPARRCIPDTFLSSSSYYVR